MPAITNCVRSERAHVFYHMFHGVDAFFRQISLPGEDNEKAVSRNANSFEAQILSRAIPDNCISDIVSAGKFASGMIETRKLEGKEVAFSLANDPDGTIYLLFPRGVSIRDINLRADDIVRYRNTGSVVGGMIIAWNYVPGTKPLILYCSSETARNLKLA